MAGVGKQPSEGDVLEGRWKLGQVIGKGGMGQVFLATDVTAPGADPVAVKVLATRTTDEEYRKRFARETNIMSRLDHPNLSRLVAQGESGGYPYLVMQYLKGSNLLDVLDANGGKLPLPMVVSMVDQLASALDYLHVRELVHRDLKLSNVLLGPDGKATLLDLGLARSVPSTTQLTRAGIIWGTPEFMAPEQVLGDPKIDGRADLYALGGIVYRALSGRLAFENRDEQKMLEAHVRAPRPDVCKLVPSLPAQVGEVIKKALAVRRDERYQTATRFADDLRAAAGVPSSLAGAIDPTVASRPRAVDATPQGLPATVAAVTEDPATMPSLDLALAAMERGATVDPSLAQTMGATEMTDAGLATELHTVPEAPTVDPPRRGDSLPPEPTVVSSIPGSSNAETVMDLDAPARLLARGPRPGPARPTRVAGAPAPTLAELLGLPVWVNGWVLGGAALALLGFGFLLGMLVR